LKEILFKTIYFPFPILWSLIFILIIVKKENLYFYLRIICIAFYLSLTPFFAYLIELPLRMVVNKYTYADNILLVLVPTAGIFKDAQSKWHPSSNTILRVSQGELLAKELNKTLVISGGILNDENISEASAVKKMLSYKNTIYDNASKNSYETVINLQNLFKTNNFKEKVLIVTSPKHVLRMSLLLSSHGFLVSSFQEKLKYKINIYSFIPDVRSINSINASLYEYIAIIKYIYMKYITINFKNE